MGSNSIVDGPRGTHERIGAAVHDLSAGEEAKGSKELTTILLETEGKMGSVGELDFRSSIAVLGEACKTYGAMIDACEKAAYGGFAEAARVKLGACTYLFEGAYKTVRTNLSKLRLSTSLGAIHPVLDDALTLHEHAPESKKAEYAGLVEDCYYRLMAAAYGNGVYDSLPGKSFYYFLELCRFRGVDLDSL